MKKLLLAGLLALLPGIASADVLFPSLGAAAAVGATDILACYQGSEPVLGCTAAQLKTFFSASPSLVTPALGTPSSGTLTNLTGLPVSTGISGLGTGVATWLATPTGANLTTALSSGGGTTNFLRADGAFTAPPGGGSVSVTASTPNTVITPSPGTGTFTVGTTVPLNAQSGNSAYTIVAGDNTKAVTRTNTVTQSDIIPQATGSFGSGFAFGYSTGASVGNTLTATTSTVNGIAGATGIKVGVEQEIGCNSDGANWACMLGLPQPATQTGTTVLRDDMTWTAFGTAGAAATGTSGHTLPYLDGANTFSGTQTFGAVNGKGTTQSGTTYTLAATDCGTTVHFSNASAVTVTIPASIVPAAGTECNIAIRQDSTGQVSVNGTAVTAATLVSAHSYTKTFAAAGATIGLSLTTIGGTTTVTLTGDGA